jgi:hypothetical protein
MNSTSNAIGSNRTTGCCRCCLRRQRRGVVHKLDGLTLCIRCSQTLVRPERTEWTRLRSISWKPESVAVRFSAARGPRADGS